MGETVFSPLQILRAPNPYLPVILYPVLYYYEQNDQGYRDYLSAYYAEYSEQLDTRDIIIKSLRMKRFLKHVDVSVDTHKERIETLSRYTTNKLHKEPKLL